jgi:hypothetical protein
MKCAELINKLYKNCLEHRDEYIAISKYEAGKLINFESPRFTDQRTVEFISNNLKYLDDIISHNEEIEYLKKRVNFNIKNNSFVCPLIKFAQKGCYICDYKLKLVSSSINMEEVSKFILGIYLNKNDLNKRAVSYMLQPQSHYLNINCSSIVEDIGYYYLNQIYGWGKNRKDINSIDVLDEISNHNDENITNKCIEYIQEYSNLDKSYKYDIQTVENILKSKRNNTAHTVKGNFSNNISYFIDYYLLSDL